MEFNINTIDIRPCLKAITAMLAKDFNQMAGYLHDNMQFIGSLLEMQDKNRLLQSQKTLVALQDIQIRSRFAVGD